VRVRHAAHRREERREDLVVRVDAEDRALLLEHADDPEGAPVDEDVAPDGVHPGKY
jgi:hypothetical protein